MQFPDNFNGKTPFWAKFGLRSSLGLKFHWGPLTKILHPPLGPPLYPLYCVEKHMKWECHLHAQTEAPVGCRSNNLRSAGFFPRRGRLRSGPRSQEWRNVWKNSWFTFPNNLEPQYFQRFSNVMPVLNLKFGNAIPFENISCEDQISAKTWTMKS